MYRQGYSVYNKLLTKHTIYMTKEIKAVEIKNSTYTVKDDKGEEIEFASYIPESLVIKSK